MQPTVKPTKDPLEAVVDEIYQVEGVLIINTNNSHSLTSALDSSGIGTSWWVSRGCVVETAVVMLTFTMHAGSSAPTTSCAKGCR